MSSAIPPKGFHVDWSSIGVGFVVGAVLTGGLVAGWSLSALADSQGKSSAVIAELKGRQQQSIDLIGGLGNELGRSAGKVVGIKAILERDGRIIAELGKVVDILSGPQ